MGCRSGQESLIIGSLPRSDALRYRCHSILSLQRVMAQLHDQAAVHMPAEAHLQLLTVLQVRLKIEGPSQLLAAAQILLQLYVIDCEMS